MSGPNVNSRFQPSMAGVGSAQNLARQADELAKLAQIQSIRDQEWERIALLTEFTRARDANIADAIQSNVDSVVLDRIRALVMRMNDVRAAAETLAHGGALPYPRTPDQLGPSGAQYSYNLATINGMLAASQDIANTRLQNAASEAAAIVDAAWAAAVPGAPDRALQGQIDDALDAIKLALSPTAGNSLAANAAAQRLLQGAVTDGDSAMIFALLGSPARRTLAALNVNRATLCRQWGEKMLASMPIDANGVRRFGSGFPGDAFLALQSTPQALANLPTLVKTYFDARMAEAKAKLATSIIQANLS